MDVHMEDPRPLKRVKVEESEATPLDNHKSDSNSSDRMKELEVGIHTWVEESRSVLYGLLKKRYTDFLVNEILLDGTVAHLRDLRPKQNRDEGIVQSRTLVGAPEGGGDESNHKASSSDKAMEPSTGVPTGEAPPTSSSRNPITQSEGQPPSKVTEVSEEDRAKLVGYFSEEVVEELISLYQSILLNPGKKSRDHPTVRTPFTSDRSIRSMIHGDIRRIFQSKIDSSTDKDGILVLTGASKGPGVRGEQNPKGRGEPNRISWKERGGDYVHFNLYKENKDTMEVISFLSRQLKMTPKSFNFAGTKDRRGVTVQRVSAYRLDAGRLAGLNRSLRYAAVGDYKYEKHGLELGDLNGNEFAITLRECSVGDDWQSLSENQKIETTQEYLSQSLNRLRNQGFLNYYGLQRFGSFMNRTDTVGLKILQGDFQGAVDAILQFSPVALEAAQSAADTHTLVGQDDRARADAINHWRMTGRTNETLDRLPRKFSAETALIRHLGRQRNDFIGALLSIQRNLRLMYVHAYQSLVFNLAVSERWRRFGDRVVEGDLVLVHEHPEKDAQPQAAQSVDADGEVVIEPLGEDRAGDRDDMFERARSMSASEAESGQYSIFDIVLPLPGFDVEYPPNALGEWYKTFMASAQGGGLDPYNMRRKQKDFSLSGGYRKILARIGESYDVQVHSYCDEDKQFVKTDMDLIKESEPENGSTETAATKPEEHSASTSPVEKPAKIAAVLKFQLGSSQYATMALRDLSKGGIQAYKAEFIGGR
ncbi:uncharacterized protein A1O9_07204 [Exophiala aquamarina CBS 119918]|uniref:TRUD domain-containing protein n=1 Tax=Exophiala aquamarina CBS 119918 TaxID=1182545 RepID=A0A072PA78_9EURO|nr:uncharacterized protein A1O9_07204 [Exophiala aquamarina CBS 119918]KEF57014.1 hypothetical protein A1O9_07204 [Exophiala aquamarina CBS 119918]